jgi:hypothetical protein
MTPSPKDTEPMLDGQAARATFRDWLFGICRERAYQLCSWTVSMPRSHYGSEYLTLRTEGITTG